MYLYSNSLENEMYHELSLIDYILTLKSSCMNKRGGGTWKSGGLFKIFAWVFKRVISKRGLKERGLNRCFAITLQENLARKRWSVKNVLNRTCLALTILTYPDTKIVNFPRWSRWIEFSSFDLRRQNAKWESREQPTRKKFRHEFF